MVRIPFHKPFETGHELEYIQDALSRGQLSGDGSYTRRVETLIGEKFGARHVFLTTSATHALEMAALLLDLGPGDEVIMPSFTFPSTANAVMLRGAIPVFAEIDPATMNLDPGAVESKITGRTRAIIPVHYAGIGCAMDRIAGLAAHYRLVIIEDAAQAVNASYRGRFLGTWGRMGCYSFHGTKNFSCGEGGALLLNDDDPELLSRAEQLIQKGTNRHQFLKGEVDKYTWVSLGSSYTPSELLMAVLYAQLLAADEITERRRRIHEAYAAGLRPLAEAGRIGITAIPDHCRSNYHLFYIILEDRRYRDAVKRQLEERGIGTASHYVPLHSSPMGRRLGYAPGDLPLTEGLSERLLRLPIWTGMSSSEVEYVIEQLKTVLRQHIGVNHGGFGIGHRSGL